MATEPAEEALDMLKYQVKKTPVCVWKRVDVHLLIVLLSPIVSSGCYFHFLNSFLHFFFQTWVLKVSIHCEGCKKKVKKVLQSIDGMVLYVIFRLNT